MREKKYVIKSIVLNDERKLYIKAVCMAKENMCAYLGLLLVERVKPVAGLLPVGSAFEQSLQFIEDIECLPG